MFPSTRITCTKRHDELPNSAQPAGAGIDVVALSDFETALSSDRQPHPLLEHRAGNQRDQLLDQLVRRVHDVRGAIRNHRAIHMIGSVKFIMRR